MNLLRLLPALLLLAAAPADPVRTAWTHLPETTNGCPDEFDYFPGGGLRILWCHAKADLPLGAFQSLLGRPLWRSGPHKNGRLDLKNHRSFGHYDPSSVDRAVELLLPGARDPAFREQTQAVYDATLQERARLAWEVRRKMLAEPACTQRELDGYVANMRAKAPAEMYYGRWFFFMNPAFCTNTQGEDWFYDNGFDAGKNGNVSDTLVAFWLRRRLDGTELNFERGLKLLLATYDAAWLAENPER